VDTPGLVRNNLGMIDQAARANVCIAIDAFLADRLTAFEFDEVLYEIRCQTQDPTAHFVIDQLWYVYDDCDDHLVCLDKPAWDAIQRLKLVLESQADVHTERERVWHGSQVIAVITLATIAYVCWCNRELWPIPVLAGGIVSMALCQWRLRELKARETPDPWRSWPFDSPSAIAQSLHRAQGFRKQRHRPEVATRRIRPEYVGRAHWFHMLYAWCVYSPLPLAAQCLPLGITRAAVRSPKSVAG
jgi:hypothetical protein